MLFKVSSGIVPSSTEEFVPSGREEFHLVLSRDDNALQNPKNFILFSQIQNSLESNQGCSVSSSIRPIQNELINQSKATYSTQLCSYS